MRDSARVGTFFHLVVKGTHGNGLGIRISEGKDERGAIRRAAVGAHLKLGTGRDGDFDWARRCGIQGDSISIGIGPLHDESAIVGLRDRHVTQVVIENVD